jgi:hypothetical protein
MNKIRQIQSALEAAGRANKYRVSFTFPSALDNKVDLADVDVLAKSASAPAKNIGQIDLWNQGRKLVIPGDTSFENTWDLSFYISEDHKLRFDMLKWQNLCDNFHKNTHAGTPGAVMTSLKVEQLDSAGNPTAAYTIHNCFPTTVGEITYGDDSENTVTECSVTFSYTDFVVGSGEEDDFTVQAATKNSVA